jgi:hypothetical protein
VVDRAPRSGQCIALERKRRAGDDAVVHGAVKHRRGYAGLSTCAALICAVTNWK